MNQGCCSDRTRHWGGGAGRRILLDGSFPPGLAGLDGAQETGHHSGGPRDLEPQATGWTQAPGNRALGRQGTGPALGSWAGERGAWDGEAGGEGQGTSRLTPSPER